MKALDRKLLRDLWAQRGSMIAIAILVAVAVASFVSMSATGRALAYTKDAYYEAYAFADVFAEVRRAPRSLVPRLAAIPGVGDVEDRVVGDGRLELADADAPVTARLVSLADRPRLNRVYLRRGRPIEPGARDEALISEGLALARGIGPGDVLTVVTQGRRLRARVVGVALSPELVYAVRTGELFPDDRHFGVLWLPRDTLAGATGLEGAFDEVSLRLRPGAREREVVAAVDRLLAPYGGLGAYGRDRHVSHRFITDEVKQLDSSSVVVSGIFLAVAAYLVSIALTRLVAAQRQQIGMLRAIGYGASAIGLHYAKLVCVVSAAGAVAGVSGGYFLGRAFARWYVDYYRLPLLVYTGSGWAVVVGIALALAAGLVGSAGAVRRAARLAPAEAMRPPAPASFAPGLLERLGITRLLSPVARMIARELGRRPLRTALGTLGLASAVAILVVGAFIGDAIGAIVTTQFERAQRQDLTVTLTTPVATRALARELADIPGVLRVEPFRAVPVRLAHRQREYRVALTGLEAGSQLQRLVDVSGNATPLRADGLVLSRQLAEVLGVSVGDAVRVEVLEGRRRASELPLRAVVDDLVGVSATAPLALVNAVADEGPVASGAHLVVDPALDRRVSAALWARPLVAASASRRAAVAGFERTVAEVLGQLGGILVAFAVTIAAGVVYNTARVSYAERERDLATARVLGFTRLETWLMLVGELATQLALALPLGWVLGYGFAALAAWGLESDLFRIPLVVSRSTFLFGAGVTTGAAAVVTLVARRWIGRLDVIGALRARE